MNYWIFVWLGVFDYRSGETVVESDAARLAPPWPRCRVRLGRLEKHAGG